MAQHACSTISRDRLRQLCERSDAPALLQLLGHGLALALTAMLVLDASQGQNALVQAEKFHEALGLTGITVTKLDGSAKGGILLAIANQLQVPVRFIGIGESAEDMQPFAADEFSDALLASGTTE